jgi:hypothetical protein
MFWIHVLGNAPAGPTVGWLADRSHAAGTTAAPIALALQSTVAAFGVAGVLFVIVARRQRREPAFH